MIFLLINRQGSRANPPWRKSLRFYVVHTQTLCASSDTDARGALLRGQTSGCFPLERGNIPTMPVRCNVTVQHSVPLSAVLRPRVLLYTSVIRKGG